MIIGASVTRRVDQKVVIAMTIDGFCPICHEKMGTDSDGMALYACKWSCPAKMRQIYQEHLEFEKSNYNCPTCSRSGRPGRPLCLNDSDFYECNECLSQFTTADFGESTWERFILINGHESAIANAVIWVRQLPTKGKRHFRDQKKFQSLLKKTTRAFNKLDRMLKTLRRNLGNKEIYYNEDLGLWVADKVRNVANIDEAISEMLVKQNYCVAL